VDYLKKLRAYVKECPEYWNPSMIRSNCGWFRSGRMQYLRGEAIRVREKQIHEE
jgi:hypothetical protein